MGTAARKGIIIKGGRYLEALAKVDTIVVDKTGTLTLGDPVVTDIKGFGGAGSEEVLALASSIEKYSEHPLARAILKEAAGKAVKIPEPDESSVLPGLGVRATVNKTRMLLGNRELMAQREISISAEVEAYCRARQEEGKTVLMLAGKDTVVGVVSVADVIREGTIEAIDRLKSLGFDEPVMMTGDNMRTARIVASRLGITNVMTGLLPQDKVERIRGLVSEGKRVVMVGDGINDAPALALAHVGISMGAAGSDAAIEASDIALMRDEWKQVPQAIAIGRNTFSVIRQNLALGIVFNLAGIGLASTGILSPTAAAVAHIVPDVLVFLNSSRLLRH
jgi:Cd2+/Zn2+-exporting ATPase/Cu+-exporting ATPase